MNLGETIRRKQQRIAELRQEITDLQAELKEARSILSGKAASREDIRSATRVVQRRPPSRDTVRKRPIKEGSSVWWARQLMLSWQRDEHIDTIVAEIARAMGRPISKPTVVSNLSRYVARNDTFTRTAENRYGLLNYDEGMSMTG
ncbi:MAG TPA: hypothetical protein VFX12_09390 [Vicinamibacterales bacterium]|nr:hypothetical protein [Vicinamibacterales bacterium]